MKITKNSFIVTTLFASLIATLMALEEFYEGEMSGVNAFEEILAYLTILGLLYLCIIVPFRILIHRINKSLNWKEHFFLRFGIQAFVVLLFSSLFGVIFGNFIHHYIDHVLPTEAVIFRTILFLSITSSILMALLELHFLKDENSNLNLLSEQLQKEKIETLYNSLKHQVNPHFLFNSLSVLSSLIQYDTKKAEEFIEHFSDIYRYVLDLNEQNLTTIEEELKFIDSYMFLQEIRFGENFSIKNLIDKEDLKRQVPPLSLQLIFENIIKHNIINNENPMEVFLKTSKDYLIIENSLNPAKEIKSNKIGINNLEGKYKLLTNKKPEFGKILERNAYSVRIPIIN